MTEQEKVDLLRRITAGYAMLTGGYDAKRNAYVWNCGNLAAGEALSGKLCASLDGYHLGVANPGGGTAFTFNGQNGERLVLSLDAIFDKTA